MPRRRSSAHRSGSIPVSARTSVDLPWSTCPAVATTYIRRTPLRGRPSSRAGRGDDGRYQGVVVGRIDRAEVKQQTAPLKAADHRRDLAPADGGPVAEREREVLVKCDRGAWQRDPRGPAAAHGRVGAHHDGRDPVRCQSAHGPFAAMNYEPLICGERPGDGRRRASDRRLEGGQGELVDPQRPGQRGPQQPPDQRLAATQEGRPGAAAESSGAGSPEPMSGTRGTPRPASSPTAALLVNPSTL